MQRTERLPLLFPRAFVGVAAGKERGISLCFLVSLRLRIPKECAGASNVRIREVEEAKTSDEGCHVITLLRLANHGRLGSKNTDVY